MHRPVLVALPETLPVSLEEAKQYVLVEAQEDEAVLTALLGAATKLLDGWAGILDRRCLVEQTWRQDFDRFNRCLRLPLGPVISIVAVRWRNPAGQIMTVNQSEYSLVTDAGGISLVRFRNAFHLPSDLYERGAVQVEYRAGFPTVEGKSTVPDNIRTAILLLASQWFNSREATITGTIATELPLAVNALLSPYLPQRL